MPLTNTKKKGKWRGGETKSNTLGQIKRVTRLGVMMIHWWVVLPLVRGKQHGIRVGHIGSSSRVSEHSVGGGVRVMKRIVWMTGMIMHRWWRGIKSRSCRSGLDELRGSGGESLLMLCRVGSMHHIIDR